MQISRFKPLVLLIAFAFTLLSNQQANASHILGGDISWKSLGNEKYSVIARIYRDCNGTNLLNTAMEFEGTCNGISKTTQTMSSAIDITPLCPGQCSRCDNRSCTFQYGVEQYDISTVIDVSAFKANNCCEITMSWSQCCRNGPIAGRDYFNFYMNGKLNVCLTNPDNSPQFDNRPQAFMCLSRDYYSSFAAQDVDTTANGQKLDSLVYSFSDPLIAADSPITWRLPYSTQKPIAYLGFPKEYNVSQFPYGIHLDSTTGEFMMRPSKLEQSMLAIKVEEYRAGKKIGEITRDMMVVVIKCPNNNAPVLSGFQCTKPTINNFEIIVCPDKEIILDICVMDNDSADSVSLSWNSAIQGAQFKILNKGAQREKAQFYWKPGRVHLHAKPYLFTVNALDNVCPVSNQTSRIYKVYVREEPFVYAGANDTFCISQKTDYYFKPNVSGGEWTGVGVPNANAGYASLSNKFNGELQYTYTYTDPFGCSGADDMTLYIGNQNNAAFKPSKETGMAPLSVDFENLSINGDFYYWNFGNGLTSQTFEPSTNYNTEGQYEVTLLAIDSLSYCQTMASKTINVEHNIGINTIPVGSIKVYPNPAQSTIFLENQNDNLIIFILYNPLGQEVRRTTFINKSQIQIQLLSPGIYTYKLIDREGKQLSRKIKIK